MFKKLIKTEQDYEAALSRIEALLDAELDTPEGDELELLSALVEIYEDAHYPIDLPDPIEAIKFRMDQLGLTQKELMPFIGSKSKVSEVLNRKRPLSLAMMRALNKGLGIPAEVLLNEPGRDFPFDPPDFEWSKLPLKEMAKKRWIPEDSKIKGNEEELGRAFIKDAGGFDSVSQILFRRSVSPRQNSKMDIYALCAWCIRVMILARKEQLKNKYKPGSLNLNDLRSIARLSYFENGPQLAKEYLEKQGVHLIIQAHLSRTYLDGASLLLEDGVPIIALTLRHDRLDNFWFCLLHELVHVIKHLSKGKEEIIVDDLDLRKHSEEDIDQREKDADELAQNALIPKKDWDKINLEDKGFSNMVMSLSEKLKINPAIIAGRIRYEKQNYNILSQFIKSGGVRKHFIESS